MLLYALDLLLLLLLCMVWATNIIYMFHAYILDESYGLDLY